VIYDYVDFVALISTQINTRITVTHPVRVVSSVDIALNVMIQTKWVKLT